LIELTAFFATFARVFSRAWQQRNVVGNHYLSVIPFSYIMGALEVFIVALIVISEHKFLLAFTIGTGGWMGSVLAMYLHTKCFSGDKERYGRLAKQYIWAVKDCNENDMNTWRALDALWNQINGGKR